MSNCMETGMCPLGSMCPDAVEVRVDRFEGKRFYLTMGHAGFNSPANNRDGYVSKAAAVAASRRYEERGRRARGDWRRYDAVARNDPSD